MDSPADPTLIARARAGDREAREHLYVQFEGSLRRYMGRRVGPKLARSVSVSDLCQDTFVKALDALKALPDEATADDFHALLYQHAGWVICAHADKQRNFQGESVLEEGSKTAPADSGAPRSTGDVTHMDEVAWLRELIGRLPENQAAVVRRRLEGHSYQRIAEQLGLSEQTVRQRHVRGSRELKRLVEDRRGLDA